MNDPLSLKLIDIVRADPGLMHVLRTVRSRDIPE